MSEFSLPTSLSQKLTPLVPQLQQRQLIQMIAWMLQHRLLFQLHTYIHFMPGSNGQPTKFNTKGNLELESKNQKSKLNTSYSDSNIFQHIFGNENDQYKMVNLPPRIILTIFLFPIHYYF